VESTKCFTICKNVYIEVKVNCDASSSRPVSTVVGYLKAFICRQTARIEDLASKEEDEKRGKRDINFGNGKNKVRRECAPSPCAVWVTVLNQRVEPDYILMCLTGSKERIYTALG
jgi:hypothetical protein